MEYKKALNYNKIAKQKDKTGSWAIIGMDKYVSDYFTISSLNSNGNDAVAYITETYLECIDSVSFKEWIKNGNEDGKVMILDETDFKRMYSEINAINVTTQGMIDDIATYYDCEWWVFSLYEYETPFFATTYFKDYNKIDMQEIERSMAVFDTLLSLKAVTEERRNMFIKRINQASNDLLNNYKIDEMTNEELFELIDEKFGIGYCNGLYEEWKI